MGSKVNEVGLKIHLGGDKGASHLCGLITDTPLRTLNRYTIEIARSSQPLASKVLQSISINTYCKCEMLPGDTCQIFVLGLVLK
jgi:hypothetical protein